MRKLVPIVLTLLLIVLSVGIHAMDTEKAVGEVLYHQNFDAVSDFGKSGIRLGTASSANAMVICPEESLEIYTYDTSRVYVLLPEANGAETDSYTIEFTFRFTGVHSENGYIAPILTCRGTEPSNITSVVIRADGTVDNFSALDDALKTAIMNGETIGVKIPVVSGVMHEITLTADDTAYTIERDNVLMINQGSMGFMVRNADVEVDEVYIVNGTGYDEKTGYYTDQSYAADESPITMPENAVDSSEQAPATGDCTVVHMIIAVVCFIGGFVCAFILGKRRS